MTQAEAVNPLPRDDATPPVTKICLVGSGIRCATGFHVIRVRGPRMHPRMSLGRTGERHRLRTWAGSRTDTPTARHVMPPRRREGPVRAAGTAPAGPSLAPDRPAD